MGTRERANARSTDGRGLTRGMRWAIAGVAIVVAAGLATAAVLMVRMPAAPPPAADALPGASGAPGVSQTQTPTPAPTPVDGSEVLPPEPHQTESARLPALPQPTPLIAAPLPADAAAQGSVVDGFPVTLAGPAPQSDIIDSSVTSDGTTMQAALNARTDQTPDELADHYRALWAGLGLAPVTSEGSTLAYADQFTSITLAAAESGTGTVYTLYATLRTE